LAEEALGDVLRHRAKSNYHKFLDGEGKMLWKEEHTETMGGSGFTRIFLRCYGRSSKIQTSKAK
jgi:hypothetical protein